MGENTKALVMLPVAEIFPHPDNPRKKLGDLTELTDSIRSFGILQNLTVVRGRYMTQDEFVQMAKLEGGDPAAARVMYNKEDAIDMRGYTVIGGHRRLEAAKAAGLTDVPCVIMDMSYQEQIRTMAMENMLRQDLTPIEQADCFQLMLDLGDTVQTIAENTGFSRNTVKRRLALKKLNRKSLEKSMERGGTISDYLELEKLDKISDRNEVLESIGTPDFADKLMRKLKDQRREKNQKAYEKELKDWAKPLPEKEKTRLWSGDWQKVAEYSLDTDEPERPKKPKDAGTVKYYWDASYSWLSIYKKAENTQEEKKRSRKTPEQQEYVNWQKESEAWLSDMDKQMYELRKAFVQDISEGSIAKNHLVYELAAEAGKLLANIEGIADKYWTQEKIYELFGLENITMRSMTDEEKAERIRTVKENPGKTLLYGIFGMHEGHEHTCIWGRDFTNNRTYYCFKKGREEKLEAEYAFLERLGYELSTDEQEMLSGKMFEDLNASAPPVPES